MGKKTPSAPAPPDPYKTAAAQGAANVETAIAQGLMNRYNQTSPFGNVTYNKIGTETVGTGETAKDIPLYEQVVNLDPSQQRQLDLTNQLGENALGVGNTLFGNVSQQVQQPFNFDNIPQAPGVGDFGAERQRVEDAIYNRATSRLDDRFARDQGSLETQLANQGLQQGSEAYTNAMKDFSFAKNDAYSNAMNDAIMQGGGVNSPDCLALVNRQDNRESRRLLSFVPSLLMSLPLYLGLAGVFRVLNSPLLLRQVWQIRILQDRLTATMQRR